MTTSSRLPPQTQKQSHQDIKSELPRHPNGTWHNHTNYQGTHHPWCGRSAQTPPTHTPAKDAQRSACNPQNESPLPSSTNRKGPSNPVNSSDPWCDFHDFYGHHTRDCRDLLYYKRQHRERRVGETHRYKGSASTKKTTNRPRRSENTRSKGRKRHNAHATKDTQEEHSTDEDSTATETEPVKTSFNDYYIDSCAYLTFVRKQYTLTRSLHRPVQIPTGPTHKQQRKAGHLLYKRNTDQNSRYNAHSVRQHSNIIWPQCTNWCPTTTARSPSMPAEGTSAVNNCNRHKTKS